MFVFSRFLISPPPMSENLRSLALRLKLSPGPGHRAARTMFRLLLRTPTARSRADWRELLEEAVQETVGWLRDFCHLIKDDDKVKMSKAVQDTWDWLDAHKVAKKKEYIKQKQDLESVVEPIVDYLHPAEEWWNRYTNEMGGCDCAFCQFFDF